MPVYAYVVLAIGWLLWLFPFFSGLRSTQPAKVVDRRARWGVLLAAISYAILWEGNFWARPLPGWRAVLSVLFLLLAILLSWTSTRALGRHLRIDAGLDSSHELVRRGPYRFIRHPIYTSMLCVLVGTGLMITPAPLFLVAACVFIAGTEIRVRIEDRLLAGRFGGEFREYQRQVSAYIPFLR
jgi:protein-S-isoprenylcysteine O-methyltransferase Ste14